MKSRPCASCGSRRTFLKNLGGVLVAATVAGRLAAVERSQVAPGATVPVNPTSPAPTSTGTDGNDWNELSDPGWSG